MNCIENSKKVNYCKKKKLLSSNINIIKNKL